MNTRVLLKLSGEALSGQDSRGFDPERLAFLVKQVRQVVEEKVQLGIVVGAGNIVRGRDLSELSPVSADHVGMLGTLINSLYMKDVFVNSGIKSVVVSPASFSPAFNAMNYDAINEMFDTGAVVIFGGGTSLPFLTTDTAAAMKAIEFGAGLLIKGTKVDGIYTADPVRDSSARKISRITYSEAINRRLEVMDTEALSLCRRYGVKIIVLDMFKDGNLYSAIMGNEVGSVVEA